MPKSRTVLLTGEPYSVLEYPRGYCSQFGTVCACNPRVRAARGTRVVPAPAMLSWFVGARMDGSGQHLFTMNRDDLRQARPEKTRLISVITSRKAFTRGHVDRLRFIRRLTARYGDRVHVYGHGFNSFADKWDVLAPYKYHIAIENSCTRDYWTEKLADCYLAGTYPLYHGCTNLADYFPRQAFTPIDIRDFGQAAAIIDQTLAADTYARRQQELAESKRLVLGKYNLFDYVADVCRQIPLTQATGTTFIRPAGRFFSAHNLWLYTVGRNYYKLVNYLHRP